MDLLRDWYNIIARNNQLAMLLVLLVTGTAFVALTAEMLAPFYGALTIAYVMDVAMRGLQRRNMSRNASLAVIYGLFVAAILALVGLVPVLGRQLAQLVSQFPQFIAKFQDIVHHLPDRYPTLVTAEQLDDGLDELRSEMLGMGQHLAPYLRGTVIGLVTTLVYLIIVPVMIFFLLKDKERIIAWLASFLPEHHELAGSVWRDVNRQLQSFVGGKVVQMVIVGIVTYIVFALIHLNYAPLLAVIVAVAVMIPYIGAAAATVPVAGVALLQWGVSFDAALAVGSYLVIHALDGNVLVPLLFSEAVAIHPVAIIVAILFFGGIWGVWGVFFAIPLAVLVKAVMTAWPVKRPMTQHV
ncbi:MAG: AI-2E family transporter [Rhodospirillaceae bacterium]|nr:AI-2E family transporter [Rhodospirillaceae bacterium]